MLSKPKLSYFIFVIFLQLYSMLSNNFIWGQTNIDSESLSNSDKKLDPDPLLTYNKCQSQLLLGSEYNDTSQLSEVVFYQNKILIYDPILPNIFFDSGSATIPSRYTLFSNPDQTLDFDESTLSGNSIQIYHQLLNIIGYRLRKNSKLILKITGCNSNQAELNETIDISLQRSVAVYNYLTKIWRIPDKQIVLMPARNLPYLAWYSTGERSKVAENRRVDLQADQLYENEWHLFKPIAHSEIEYTPYPSIICFEARNNISDSTILRRQILITRNGEVQKIISNINSNQIEVPCNLKDDTDSIMKIHTNDFEAQLIIICKDGTKKNLIKFEFQLSICRYYHQIILLVTFRWLGHQYCFLKN